jgi:hypothetical protein
VVGPLGAFREGAGGVAGPLPVHVALLTEHSEAFSEVLWTCKLDLVHDANL